MKVAGEGDFPHHILYGRSLRSLWQFPWPTEGRALFSAEAVGVQDRDSPTAQPQAALCCPPQYSHQSGQLKSPLTRSSGAALHLFD